MPEPLDRTIRAIVQGNSAEFARLLKANPRSALGAVMSADHLETQVAHWLYKGDTALHVAAAGYRGEIARMLLKAGADAKAALNRRRAQPLHYAADGSLEHPNWDAKRQVAMIRLLLENGAEVDAQDANGASALHRAVRTRCARAAACLLEAGADAALRNKSGSTAFHLAVQNTGRGGSGADVAKEAQLEIIRLFVKRGLSVDLRDGKGKSVLDAATSEAVRDALHGGPSSA
jgi:ankyrin repeat protein